MSRTPDFSALKTIAILTSPQHVMNLAQAFLAGRVQTPLLVYILVPDHEHRTHVESSTIGTIEFFTQIFRDTEFRFVKLKRITWEIQIAILVRQTRLKQLRCPDIFLGLKPSGLWARSFPATNGGEITLLDDGAETLSTDFSKVLNGDPSTSHGKIYDAICRIIAGPIARMETRPHLYTCFPSVDTGHATIETHNYEALLAALAPLRIPGELHDSGGIFIDSNFNSLDDTVHLDLVKEIHYQIGFDYYVPHRRTSRKFALEVTNSLPVTTIRPSIPIEICMSSWLLQGNRVMITPSFISRTGPLFAVGLPNLYSINLLPWLEKHVADVRSEFDLDHAITLIWEEAAYISDGVTDSPKSIALKFVDELRD